VLIFLGRLRGDKRCARKTRWAPASCLEASANAGAVHGQTWATALEEGWSDAQVTEVFAYVGLVQYVASFVRFARTELDPPAARPARPVPGAA
jgi:hypothetical protein